MLPQRYSASVLASSLTTSVAGPFCAWMLVVLFCSPAAIVAAQDAAANSLADLQQQWKAVNGQLDKTQAQLESGQGDGDELRGKYADQVDEANNLITQIRTAAMKDLKSSDGDQPAATRALMGILLNEAKAGDDAAVLLAGDFLIEQKINPIWLETAAKSQRIPIESREIFDELLIRQREANANDLPRVKLTTTEGDIVVELFENEAPETVGNFISLVEAGFYKNIDFHRVLEGFMAQTGCPDGTGGGGPGYKIECECDSPTARPHFTGSLSMAHAGKDTGGSQFFLTFARTSMLDGRHTAFGRVIEGLDVLENLHRTHVSINGREEEIPDIKKDRILSAEVIRKREHAYRPNKVGVDEPPLEEAADDSEDDSTAEQVDAEEAADKDAKPKPSVTPPKSEMETPTDDVEEEPAVSEPVQDSDPEPQESTNEPSDVEPTNDDSDE